MGPPFVQTILSTKKSPGSVEDCSRAIALEIEMAGRQLFLEDAGLFTLGLAGFCPFLGTSGL
jgi:hypothetical protein